MERYASNIKDTYSTEETTCTCEALTKAEKKKFLTWMHISLALDISDRYIDISESMNLVHN